MSAKSFVDVGSIGDQCFAAHFSGPGGLPVLFSGVIRVHRQGGSEDPGRRYFFECFGKGWGDTREKCGVLLDVFRDDIPRRWFDQEANEVSPTITPKGPRETMLATTPDYYDVILPTLKRLEKMLPANENEGDIEPYKVGMLSCWRYRRGGNRQV
jgi:hypothetical protein